ncbi:MAG: 30S ribosomal protein S6 [Deltaproteobacteria bacterium]|nr:30S ribosomal protein S6 [Deltaproteobacteria bacterium]
MTDETTHYETLYIVHPVHSGRNQDLCDRFRGVLEGQGATVTHFEEWGIRDLAYPIEKQGKGFYNLIQYQASAGTSEELERLMRLSDEVMRCMTVVLDEDVRSLARAEEPAAAAEPAPSPEPMPAAESAPAAEPAPAAESAPAVEPAPATELAPAAESTPATEPAPQEPVEEVRETQEGSKA